MNTHQITINWDHAKSISAETIRNQSKQQKEAIELFLSSSHEMTDARDLLYFQEETGKDIYWLIENGKNLSSKLTQPLLMGACLDDLIDLDVYDYSQEEEDEEEEPNLILLNESVKIYFMPITAEKYIIHVADYFGIGLLFPDGDAIFDNLEECAKIDPSKFIEFAKEKNII